MTSQVQIPENLSTITRRGVSRIISEEDFTAMLRQGRPLRLKMGFDPSRPDIHLGHVVGLRKLRQLQDLGHQVILIVGDWTAQIGDPSGRSATRTMLTHAEVLENAESYMRQFFKVVDRDRTQVEWQSQWFGEFTLANVIELTSRFTINQFLHREDFANRYSQNQPIAITEMLYPLMQAYDSVVIESDVEFGGTDQMFNLLVGRELQGMMGQTPQQCFMMPILVGTDGVQKMSKSLGNYVALEEPPEEMYGKLMSLPDELITSYYEYLTDVPDADIDEMTQAMKSETANPMDFKKGLAHRITTTFHDNEAADGAQSNFEQVVQRRDMPDEMPEVALAEVYGLPIHRLLVQTGLASSNGEARRLLTQGAVELIRTDGQRTSASMGDEPSLNPGDVVRAGRRRFVRVVE
ncbi:Tyrosine--tRNA ligase [Geodia barretti]|uniref:Tyrosine--tRNA ligase n=1 Tax=Geodia barretti TaxID=519541 RepID=A0AA35SEG4_GEOBA|nr:Tyrosine--tRNA ligase [Geodia barretti]